MNTAWTERWQVERHRTPFTWALIDRFFGDEEARVLIDAFPSDGFCEVGDGTAGYRFWFRRLISASRIVSNVRFLHPVWLETTACLVSPAFRDALAATLGVAAGNLKVDAGICIYNGHSGLAPHTDRPHRVVTEVLYLNPEWKAQWGGELLLLGSPDPSDIVHSIPPVPNRAVTILRSDSSWHAVTPPARNAPRDRRSLLLHLTYEQKADQ